MRDHLSLTIFFFLLSHKPFPSAPKQRPLSLGFEGDPQRQSSSVWPKTEPLTGCRQAHRLPTHLWQRKWAWRQGLPARQSQACHGSGNSPSKETLSWTGQSRSAWLFPSRLQTEAGWRAVVKKATALSVVVYSIHIHIIMQCNTQLIIFLHSFPPPPPSINEQQPCQ